MSELRQWRLRGQRMKKPLHYTMCGLDDVYLVNGYRRHRTSEGLGVSITNLDGLHQAIGRSMVERKKLLNGKEVRFLRTQMDLTQSELARLIGCDAQQIARYEKGENKIPGPADRLLRMIYLHHFGGGLDVRDILEALDQMDARLDESQVFRVTSEGWQAAA
ncbi:MAG: helix-turn-helix domain-containing protein [Alphaproteobacteria bacterium]